jgi:ribonuclease BN (tRNA processing enzyme)
MNLTVVGCSTPFPRREDPCSGYLLSSGKSSVLLDCGSGVFGELLEYVHPNDLSGIWISHMHPDHFADMPAVANWALNTGNARKLPVYGPEEWDARLDYFLTGEKNSGLSTSIFEVGYISDGLTVDIGGLRITSREVHHSVKTFGARVDFEGKSFAYSGDTGPCAALAELASGVDLFLCEAGSENESEYHLTARQAFEIALSGGVDKLLLTHVPDRDEENPFPDFGSLSVEMAYPRGNWII